MKLPNPMPAEIGVKPSDLEVVRSSDRALNSPATCLVRFMPLLPPATEVEAPTGAVRTRSQEQERAGDRERGGESTARSQVMIASHIVAVQVFEISTGTRAADATGQPTVRMMADPVVVQMQATGERSGNAALNLTHPELGSVRLSLQVSEGQVDVKMSVNTTRAAQTLRASEQGLRTGMAKQGIELRTLTVDVLRRRRAGRTDNSRERSEQLEQEES